MAEVTRDSEVEGSGHEGQKKKKGRRARWKSIVTRETGTCNYQSDRYSNG